MILQKQEIWNLDLIESARAVKYGYCLFFTIIIIVIIIVTIKKYINYKDNDSYNDNNNDSQHHHHGHYNYSLQQSIFILACLFVLTGVHSVWLHSPLLDGQAICWQIQ